MERIPIVDVIIEKDNKILMLRRNFYPENKLDLLGGYVDKNEAVEKAAVREAQEESGFDVELVRKLGEYDYLDRGEKKTHIFIGKIIGGELRSSREGDPVWIDPKKITSNDLAFPQVHVKILNDYFKLRRWGVTIRH